MRRIMRRSIEAFQCYRYLRLSREAYQRIEYERVEMPGYALPSTATFLPRSHATKI